MRKNFSRQAFRDLRERLKVISGRNDAGPVQRFNEAISQINDFMKTERERVLAGGFSDPFDEIYYFKFEKPEYQALKIFEVSVFSLRDRLPKGPAGVLRTYYLGELEDIGRFFKRYAFLYTYFRQGYTELDEQLFVRGALVQSVLLPEVPELDPDFSTGGDYLLAQFMAFEQLQDHIVEELRALEPTVGNGGASSVVELKKWFDWTGDIINLVELGYAIFLSRQLNGGKARLSEIFRFLEVVFGVEIGIPANRFREIKRRKRLSRTHFTDGLREALIAYMDADDAFTGAGE